MIRITHILWRPLDGFQIKIHQPFCYFCRTITLLQRFLYETLLELKIWVTWKHGNIKPQLTCLRSSLSAEGECTGWETWDLLSQTKWSWALMWWKWSFGICRRELVSAGCDCTDAFEPCKRKKREECDMFLWWPFRENCSFASWIRQAQQEHWIQQTALHDWKKNFHLLINYSKMVYYFIFLGIFPWSSWD